MLNENIEETGIEKELSGLEEILEKQLILVNSEGPQSRVMETALEEDSTAKIEDDRMVKQRLEELIKKGFHFQSSAKLREK